MPTRYYVRAKVAGDGQFADCEYFYDKEGQLPVNKTVLKIPHSANAGYIEQVTDSPLWLIGATYKTLGQAPAMNASNFSPADDQNSVQISMPDNSRVTKGVVLLFSNPGNVENLYPSADPQLTNEGDGED